MRRGALKAQVFGLLTRFSCPRAFLEMLYRRTWIVQNCRYLTIVFIARLSFPSCYSFTVKLPFSNIVSTKVTHGTVLYLEF